MDLRSHMTAPLLIEAKRLIASTGLFYQPFIFSDDLEVGAGYTFLTRQPGAGLVHWPGYAQEKGSFAGNVADYLITPEQRQDFTLANEDLRRQYDGWVDQICQRLAPIADATVADIGCFSGYIPFAFARRGALRAVGYDRDDRQPHFSLLERILGAKAEFVHAPVDNFSGAIADCPVYDLVVSMSVLQHMTEPLRHLHFLRSITRRAMLIVTNVWTDDEHLIRYGDPNMVDGYDFPWCFDNSVYLSEKMLRTSLERAGATDIVELSSPEFAIFGRQSEMGRNDYDGAPRAPESASLKPVAWLVSVDGEATGGAADLRKGYGRVRFVERRGAYGIVAYRAEFFAVPTKLGPWDIREMEKRKHPEVLSATSLVDLYALL